MTQRGRLSPELVNAAKDGMRRARSVACMTQLQAKQKQDFIAQDADEADRASADW